MGYAPYTASVLRGSQNMSRQGLRLGRRGEDLACAFLKKKGLGIIARNYRHKCGEVDIIARDREYLVFVEVKTRSSLRFGQPYEAVTASKQAQICRLATHYLSHEKIQDQAVRFDVISILLPATGAPTIEHLVNCFEASGNIF